MLKHPLFSFMALFIVASAMSQDSFRKNDLYFELAGNGIFASVNFERQLHNKPGLGARIGIGYFSGDEKFRVSIPVGVNYLITVKDSKSFIDAGLGATWSGTAGLKTAKQDAAAGGRDYGEHAVSAVPSIGYRRHTNAHFMWRTNVSAVINKYRVIPWFGLSVGKRL